MKEARITVFGPRGHWTGIWHAADAIDAQQAWEYGAGVPAIIEATYDIEPTGRFIQGIEIWEVTQEQWP